MTTLNFFCNHKCGSAWFYKLLRDFSNQNTLQFTSTNRGWKGFSAKELAERSLVFYRNSEYGAISAACDTGVRIVRNPLSIVTSAYFSHLQSHNIGDWRQLKRQRELLQNTDKETGMALTVAFLEKSDFYFNSAGPLNVLDNWMFEDKRFVTLRMEDFVLEPNFYLRKAIAGMGYDPESFQYLDEEKYTFEQFSGRKKGKLTLVRIIVAEDGMTGRNIFQVA